MVQSVFVLFYLAVHMILLAWNHIPVRELYQPFNEGLFPSAAHFVQQYILFHTLPKWETLEPLNGKKSGVITGKYPFLGHPI